MSTALLPDHLKLRRANGKAPHKPVLLLAVMEAIGRGLITENRIEPDADLINLFQGYWKALVPEGTFQRRFYLPFYFLSGDLSGLWKFHALPGFQESLTRSRTPKSLSSLRQFHAWAELREDVFTRWSNPDLRLRDQLEIMRRYFGSTQLPTALPDQLRDIEYQIEHSSRDQYVADQLQLPMDEEEEIQVLRGEAFKRTIPRIYGYSCAITGLRVQNTRGVKLIDACHIRPWADSYDDTVTNGIALSPTLHRAFDRGLISIAADYTVLVTPDLRESESAHAIRPYAGMQLHLPQDTSYLPAQDNLEWHRKRWGYGG